MKRDTIHAVLYVFFFFAIMLAVVGMGCARYNECRRVHPWWYCAGDK